MHHHDLDFYSDGSLVFNEVTLKVETSTRVKFQAVVEAALKGAELDHLSCNFIA